MEQLETRLTKVENRLTDVEAKLPQPTSLTNSVTNSVPTSGGFFGGSGGGVIPNTFETGLYTGPVMGGQRRTRRHKNKRHSYSRKNKKGLKKRIKNMFGFRGGSEMPASPGFSLTGLKKGGTTNVKSPL